MDIVMDISSLTLSRRVSHGHVFDRDDWRDFSLDTRNKLRIDKSIKWANEHMSKLGEMGRRQWREVEVDSDGEGLWVYFVRWMWIVLLCGVL